MVEKTSVISTIGEFTCIQLLGSGSQARVMLAKKQNGERFALKIFTEPILQDLKDDWKNKRN